MADYEIAQHGDAALLVTFGTKIDPAINRRVLDAAGAFHRSTASRRHWLTAIPAYASLLVEYDPLAIDAGTALTEFEEVLRSVEPSVLAADDAAPPVEITVAYGRDAGPDLDAVAERCGMTPAQVVEAHSSVVYRAYMLGFAPGFAYLGELPAELELPRRESPRQRVPAGSVAIAGRQTAVYPQSSPGGWHLIGRTDALMWDIARQQPALITPGSRVRFVARA